MYKSYPWPGACSLRGEVKLFAKWVKELFDGLFKEIQQY